MNCERKTEDMLDKQIKSALRARAEEVAVSAGLDEAVWRSVGRAKIRRGAFDWLAQFASGLAINRRLFGKKLLVTFCALFCLSCCGVMAAAGGAGSGWVSHSGPYYHFDNFAQTVSIIENLEYTPKYVESLAGDYDFQGGYISQTQRLDENGHRMSHVYKELFMDYVNAQNGEVVTLVVSNTPFDYSNDEGWQEVKQQIGDIELVYATQPYKFVPVSYVLTEEDKAALADGSLQISVGSDEIERTLNVSVFWTQEGVNYHLFGWDLSLSAEEMLNMAADFIEQTGAQELN